MPEHIPAFYRQTDTTLEHLTISDGVVSLGTCAFANCPNLSSVTIPNTLVNIGQGAFRECPCLSELYFAEGGTKLIELGRNAFAQTPLATTINGLVEAENFRRAASKVRLVYEYVKGTSFFISYKTDYERESVASDNIPDWSHVQEDMLRHLVWDRKHGVSSIRMGGMSAQCFDRIDKVALCDVCKTISNSTEGGLISIVDQQRARFYALLKAAGETNHLHEVYNRIVCAVCRSRCFVQVLDASKLHRLETFFADNKLRLMPSARDRFAAEDWTSMSLNVFSVLRRVLPSASVYEIGVFAWCLVDVLGDERAHNDDSVYIEMRNAVREGLRGVGIG